MEFDIVTPLGPDDVERFKQAVEYTKRNVIGYRHIYVVCPAAVLNSIRDVPGIIPIDESIYPFDLEDMTTHIGPIKRRGWYLQQLLKLYAGFIIPNILPRWLVIDGDTFFLKPTRFLEGGKPCYNPGNEYTQSYFDHAARLHPSLRRADPALSGITHHMLFEAPRVSELFELVEAHHRAPFWRAFMDCVAPHEYERSGASEYELYFNFMMLFHRSEIVLRPLRWENVFWVDTSRDLDYISAHEWMHQMFLSANRPAAR
jgi:hypothetical protein